MNVDELAAKIRSAIEDGEGHSNVVIVIHQGTGAQEYPIASAEWSLDANGNSILQLWCHPS